MPRRPKTAAAVHPNVGVRVWYQERLQHMVDKMHAELVHAVEIAFEGREPGGIAHDSPDFISNEIERVVAAFDAKKPSIDLLRRALNKWGKLWTLRLETLSDNLAADFANKSKTVTDAALANSFRKAGLTVRFRPTKAMISAQKAVIAENVHLIKSIPAEYLTKVQNDVWRTVTKTGGDLKTLTDKLRHTYDITHNRAALIANDQNNKAKAVYEAARRTELGITQAIWMHSQGGVEPRPSHVALNGKVFDVQKGAWDSQEGEWIQPGELINCRCVSRPVVEGFD